MLTWDKNDERYFHHGLDRGVLYPKDVPAPVLRATNLATQPIMAGDVPSTPQGAGVSGQYYAGNVTQTLVPAGQDGPLVKGVRLPYRRKTLTSTAVGRGSFNWLLTARSPDSLGPFANPNGTLPVVPGRTYRVSYYARNNIAGVATVGQSLSAAGYANDQGRGNTLAPALSTANNNEWKFHSFTLTPQAGYPQLAIRTNHAAGAVAVGDTADIAGLIITDVTDNPGYVEPYFDGSSTDELNTFEWLGVTNASQSIRKERVGTAVPWNGITGMEESGNGSSAMYYIDGKVFLADVDATDFSGKLSAYSWPDQFSKALGFPEVADGLYVDNQKPQQFSFSYRTLIGSGLSGDMFGYQIHLVYKAIASFNGRSRKTINASPGPMEFGFDIVCTPVQLSGYRPTAHYVIDTRHLAQNTIDRLEGILYGDDTHAPRMPTPTELYDLLNFGSAITFTKFTHPVLGECWTASGSFANVHYTGDGSTFEILNVNGVDLGGGQYQLSDTP